MFADGDEFRCENAEVILAGLGSLTFPQHIAVTMATAVLRVASEVRVRDEEGRSEDKRP